MTQFRKAQVTIVATVFVPEHEIDGVVSTIRLDSEGTVTEEEAFEQLALAKIDAVLPAMEDVLKIREIDVDMSTYE